MVKTVFIITYDVMTYVTWQRQDDVTYAKMCLPSLVTDTMRRFLRLESSKKLQGKNARGVVSTLPGRPRVNDWTTNRSKHSVQGIGAFN